MANQRLSNEKQALVLMALAEGTPIRAVCRMFSVGQNTVKRVIEETGEALIDYMGREFRDLPCQRLALDEQWQYVGQHGQRMAHKEAGKGDFWLWAGLDCDTKLVVSFHVGSRGQHDCEYFVNDLAKRVTGSPQITTDQFRNYKFAIRGAFGDRCTYATETKEFVEAWPHNVETKRKNGIPKIARAERKAVWGEPDLGTATTAHVERLFLTVRQELKRFQRLTLGYSKDLRMHKLATALHIGIYNLVRKHGGLDGQTPAQAAGVESERWTMKRVVEMTASYWQKKEEAAFETAFAALYKN